MGLAFGLGSVQPLAERQDLALRMNCASDRVVRCARETLRGGGMRGKEGGGRGYKCVENSACPFFYQASASPTHSRFDLSPLPPPRLVTWCSCSSALICAFTSLASSSSPLVASCLWWVGGADDDDDNTHRRRGDEGEKGQKPRDRIEPSGEGERRAGSQEREGAPGAAWRSQRLASPARGSPSPP